MNNYITLDGKKYVCPHGRWIPFTDKPMTIRRNLDATLDVTYGPDPINQWKGTIRTYPKGSTPPTGYGNIGDLKTTIEKKQSVNFTDHHGSTYTVHIQGPFPERAIGPMWTSHDNLVDVTLVAE